MIIRLVVVKNPPLRKKVFSILILFPQILESKRRPHTLHKSLLVGIKPYKVDE